MSEVVVTKAERAMFRYEAGLGVCSDPRGEFGRDYRILAVLDALDDTEAHLAAARSALAAVREVRAAGVGGEAS